MEKGNKKQPVEVKSPGVQVNREDLTQLIPYLQKLQVGSASTEASGSKEFTPSPIAKSRLGIQGLRKPGTKVLSEDSVKHWTALGGPRKIRKLRTKE